MYRLPKPSFPAFTCITAFPVFPAFRLAALALCGLPGWAAAAGYSLREYVTPYWDTDTMYNESVLMVSDSGKAAEAALLFPPATILSVKSANLDTVFQPGVDWSYANGKLKLMTGSKAAFLTTTALYPATSTPGWDMPKVGGGYVLFQEGHYFHDRQLAVTYTHARNLWKGPVPKYAETTLPRTLDKLAKGQPIKLVLLGNSITAGYNSSKFTGAAPLMPVYGELAAENLRANFASVITVKNVAIAGKLASWGAANAHTLVTAENPDLVVISFGMNDGSSNIPADTFLVQIKAIIADVRASNSAAEFILFAPMLANPESGFSGSQALYKAKLQTLIGAGVDVVDMTGVHQELLKHKAYRDMTGNNINHPNDFLHRWYAQQMSGLLIKPKPDPTLIPVTDANLLSGLSPLNWVRKPDFIASSIGAASLKVGFTGTRVLKLNVDTKIFKTATAARYPILAWSINKGTLRSHQLAQGETTVLLDSGTVDPVVDLYCRGFSPFENRWLGDAPENSVKITGFSVDAGAKTVAQDFPAKVWMTIGNSIESGDAALYASGAGRPPDDVWAASDDGRASYGYLLATHFGYRESRLAYGGYNWGGNGGMAKLTTLIDSITSTVPRLTGSKLVPTPDVVLITLGENGVPAAADVINSLVKLRSRVVAATKIMVMIPVSGRARAEVTAAFTTYKSDSKDTSAYPVDLGTITFATADGQHPTAGGHVSIYNAALPVFTKMFPTLALPGHRVERAETRAPAVRQSGSFPVPAFIRVESGTPRSYSPAGKRLPEVLPEAH